MPKLATSEPVALEPDTLPDTSVQLMSEMRSMFPDQRGNIRVIILWQNVGGIRCRVNWLKEGYVVFSKYVVMKDMNEILPEGGIDILSCV